MSRMLRSARVLVFCLASVLCLATVISAQDSKDADSVMPSRMGGPQDWSNRHVIFTRAATPEQLEKFRDDPRFIHSFFQRYFQEHRKDFAAAAALNNIDVREPSDESNEDQFEDATWDPSLRENQLDLGFQPFLFWDPLHRRQAPSKNSKVDWSMSLGPTAGTAVGESPAIYTANYSSPSCANDFAIFTVNATPATSGQGNLVALNNLYSDVTGAGFCTAPGPTFMFSYAIGSGGSALSPVTSYDGTRVAWIENRSATSAYLHITVWVAGQGGTALDAVAPNGTYSNGACTTAGQSCDYAINYTASAYTGCSASASGNSHSDLYVDYGSGGGFISANNGILYHIANIFSKTVTPTIDYCILVNSSAGSAMSGPVYDPATSEVFITDSEKIYAFNFSSTSGFTAASPASYTFGNSASNYGYPTGPGPLLDMFNGYLYVFSTYDAASKTSVTQIPVSLASGTAVELGAISTNADPFLFYGAFDNNYYTYGPKSSKSTLYTCGTDKTTTTIQDLFAISFNAATGIVNTTPAMSNNTNINPGGAAGVCSPLTEFYDGTNDRLFVGMGQPGSAAGANVVTMWNINTQLTGTGGSTSPTYTAEATGYLGGTSGIDTDNNSSDTDAESIYFATEQIGATGTDASAAGFSLNGIAVNGKTFSCTGGLDNDGNSYSATLLGTTVTWNGMTFNIGPTNNANSDLNVWSNTIVTLPTGSYSTLTILAAAVNVTDTGISESFSVNYTDGSSTTYTQSFSDWFNPLGFGGESIAKSMAYRNTCSGGEGTGPFDLYGYSFPVNPKKTVSTLTLPTTRNVVVLAAAVSNNCGGADYCAVKLTQSGLQ
jgi:hypothetical protein